LIALFPPQHTLCRSLNTSFSVGDESGLSGTYSRPAKKFS
jgi:hypothetical protein